MENNNFRSTSYQKIESVLTSIFEKYSHPTNDDFFAEIFNSSLEFSKDGYKGGMEEIIEHVN
jgi:hypothetical protein